MTARTFAVHAIESQVVAALRVRDDAGRRPVTVVDAEGGSPLRCCLRTSRPGEELLLVSYAPLRRWAAGRAVDPGPYDEVDPVFVHPSDCGGPDHDGYPDDLRGTPRVFRGYDANGRIVAGLLANPDDDHERVIESLLDDERVAVVHARALGFGCFTFAIDRPDGADAADGAGVA